MIIIGIDPGVNTGIAVFNHKLLTDLCTIRPFHLTEVLSAIFTDISASSDNLRVIYEDSRLTSPVWSRGTNKAALIKIARNVGQVDAVCSMIVDICEQYNVPCHGISPKNKGKKIGAEEFNKLTGWQKKSNQHERDAAMCVISGR